MSGPACHPTGCGGLDGSINRSSILWRERGIRELAADPRDQHQGRGGCTEGWRPAENCGGVGPGHLRAHHHGHHTQSGTGQGEHKFADLYYCAAMGGWMMFKFLEGMEGVGYLPLVLCLTLVGMKKDKMN